MQLDNDRDSDIRVMDVSEPWVTHIFNGVKKVEVRKNGRTWGNIQPEELLIIREKTSNRKMCFKVKAVRKYESLIDCFVAEGIRNLLPGMSALIEAYDVYLGFDGAENRLKRKAEYDAQGVIAIELAFYSNNC